MGLDMFLYATKYVGGWAHGRDPAFDKIADAVGVRPVEGSLSIEVRATVGYWRKANAIHAWFVEKVQDGVDECQETPVSREELTDLRNTCASVLSRAKVGKGKVHVGTVYDKDGKREEYEDGEVIENAEEIAAILPSRDGCFFGSTDYDEGYLADVRNTVGIIDRVLADPALEGWDFSYRSSW